MINHPSIHTRGSLTQLTLFFSHITASRGHRGTAYAIPTLRILYSTLSLALVLASCGCIPRTVWALYCILCTVGTCVCRATCSYSSLMRHGHRIYIWSYIIAVLAGAAAGQHSDHRAPVDHQVAQARAVPTERRGQSDGSWGRPSPSSSCGAHQKLPLNARHVERL
jgi:hypothetical protein